MNILELAILKKMVGGGGGSGTDNYNDLSNLPQINGETLAGNKTAGNLGLQDALTFDSAPTEDSTNPVESGGVYNALAGKQDNLTFDDDPTENSTNPVKSGGVYNALTGKQDNLTFDGVYNASTNKAATESTVTNAIAGLDVSAFSVDAGETISSISETDGKISVTKQDIAIASNQVTAMTGYTKPSSAPATPAIQTSDTANQAFGKLEFKADTNQTNILYALGKTGRNHFDLDMSVVKKWNTSGTWNGNVYTQGGLTFTFNSDGTIDVSGTATERVNVVLDVYYPLNTEIGYRFHDLDGLVLSGCPTGGAWNKYSLSLQMTDSPWTSAAIDTGSGATINNSALPANTTFVAFYLTIYASYPTSSFTFKPMFCTQEDWSIAHDYTPYRGAPNYDLTYREAEDRAGLVECVDGGAKNIIDVNNYSNLDNVTISNGVFTTQGDTLTTLRFDVYLRNGSTTLLKIVSAQSISSNGVYYWEFVAPTGTNNVLIGHNGGTYNGRATINLTNLVAGQRYAIQVNVTQYQNASGAFKWQDVMVCTKAAFGVSQKFVPYRMSYQDLCDKKDAALSTTSKTSGSLDDIAENSFYFVTDGTTGRPVTEYGFVKTSVYTSSVMLQVFISYSGNASNSSLVYVRVKQSGTWQAWKLLTNA